MILHLHNNIIIKTDIKNIYKIEATTNNETDIYFYNKVLLLNHWSEDLRHKLVTMARVKETREDIEKMMETESFNNSFEDLLQ